MRKTYKLDGVNRTSVNAMTYKVVKIRVLSGMACA